MSKYTSLQKKERKDILQKAVLAMLAMGMVAWPSFSVVYAANSDFTGHDGHIENTGKVHNIYAGSNVGNNVGVNKFTKFDVAQNEIANLHFTRWNGGAKGDNFNTLMNFVNDRININGTVNAIRGSGIGGHLFFLSPGGMVVGASGAINTGSLTVMTPTQKWWDNKFQNNVTQDIVTAVSAMAVPINASGTIAIQGKINATDDIRMKAGKINIGMDLTDGDKKAAQLITGTTDFASLVNMDDTELENAGVTDLVASRTEGSGDIILVAEVSYNANKDVVDADKIKAEINIVAGSKIEAARNADITATALNNSNLLYFRDKNDVGQYVVNDELLTEQQFKVKYGESATSTSILGSAVKTQAVINITNDGAEAGKNTTITGQAVKVVAKGENVFSNSETTTLTAEQITKYTSMILLNGLDVCYGDLENKAEVNIGKDTVLTAKGATGGTEQEALTVKALAEMQIGLGTNAGSLNLLQNWNYNMNFFPSVMVNFASAQNEAKVNIAGTLTSTVGGMAVDALAKNKIASTDASGFFGLGIAGNSDAVLSLGINGINGWNKSNLVITEDANLTAARNISVDNQAISSIISENSVTSTEKSVANFVISWIDYDNIATMDVAGTITTTANGNITLDNEAVYTDNTFKATASAGLGFVPRTVQKIKHKVDETCLNNLSSGVSTWVQGLLGTKAIKFAGEGVEQTSLAAKLADYLKLGLTIGVFDEENTATITLQPTAEIKAKGNLTVRSQAVMEDIYTQVIGTTVNAENFISDTASSTPRALVNGVFFLRDIANESNIKSEKGTAGEYADLQGADISLTSMADAGKYWRLQRMNTKLQELKDSISNLPEWKTPSSEDVKILKEYYDRMLAEQAKLEKELYDAAGNLKPEYSSEDGGAEKLAAKMNEFENSAAYKEFYKLINEGKYTKNGVEHTITEQQETGVFTKIKNALKYTFSGLVSYCLPPTYFNYYISSESSTKEGPGSSSFAAGVSLGLDSVANNSRILVGQNTNIKGSGKVNIAADTHYNELALNGTWLWDTAGTKGGALSMATVHHLDNNSIVTVTEGAKVEGGNITGNVKNAVRHIDVAKPIMTSPSGVLIANVIYYGGVSNSVFSVDDEAILKATDTKGIEFTGNNTTDIIFASGSLATGHSGSGVFTVSYIGIDRNNIVAIADNGGVATLANASESEQKIKEDDDEEKRLKKILVAKGGLNKEKTIAFYTETAAGRGTLTADNFKMNTLSDGLILNIVADVAASANSADDGDQGVLGGVMNWVSDKFSALVDKVKGTVNNGEDMIELQNLGENNQELNNNQHQVGHDDPHDGGQGPKFTLAGAGSAGVIELDGKTVSMVSGMDIDISTANAKGNMDIHAKDDSKIITVAGGAAISKQGTANGEGNKNIVFAGAAGINNINSSVSSIVSNNKIDNYGIVKNWAEREGTLANAAAAISFTTSNDSVRTSSFAFGATVNLSNYSTDAKMTGNEVNTVQEKDKFTNVTNLAQDKDLQVTGGLDVNVVKGGKKSFGLGAVVTWAFLDNDVNALVSGGTYKGIDKFVNEAATDLTQINAALGVGIATGTSGGNTVQGAVVYNKLDNDVTAKISGGITIEAYDLTVSSYDANFKSVDPSKLALEGSHGFDVDGSDYLAYVNKETKDAKEDDNKEDLQKQGNLIVGAAVEITAVTGGGGAAVGASAVIGITDNDFNSIVENSTITLGKEKDAGVYTAKILAESSTLSVGVAAGGNGTSKGIAGGGSVVVNRFKDNVVAKVSGSTLDVSDLQIIAANKQKLVNVAGQFDVGTNVVGLDMVYNYLFNTTGAYLENSEVWKKKNATDYAATNITLDAANDSDIYAIAVGISAGASYNTTLAANGSVAVNRGQNNVEAKAVNNSGTVKNLIGLKKFTVHSNNDDYMAAAAGGLTATSGKVALGGALTWNRLGSLKLGEHGKIETDENAKQVNDAMVGGYDIHLQDAGEMNIMADDTANFKTVSIGIGLGGADNRFTVQGANANAYLVKTTTASLNGGSINNNNVYGDNTKFADVNITADTDNDFDTVSLVVATSGNAAFGAGLSQNTMKADTLAQALANTAGGSTYNVKDMLVKAKSYMNLTNVAVGVAGTGGLSVGGSVVDNVLKNNTTALVGSETVANLTKITTKGSLGVVSESSEDFDNYSGQANLTFGGIGGGGLALSFNDVGGDTLATVQNADIVTNNSTGKSISFRDSTDYDEKTEKYRTLNGTGLVVSADALHDIYNATFSGGLVANMGEEVVALGIDAVAGVNNISGNTKAKVFSANLNYPSAGSDGGVEKDSGRNLTVRSTDKIKSTSSVSNAALTITGFNGISGTVGVGVSKDIESRTVSATVTGDTTNDRKYINTDKMDVTADSFADLKIVNTAVSISASEAISGSVTTGVSYTDLNVTTDAEVDNVFAYNSGLNILANHEDDLDIIGTGATLAISPNLYSGGVAIGVHVDSENNTARTTAGLKNSTINHYSDNTAEDSIKAVSVSDTLTQDANISVAASIISGSVGVMVQDNDLKETAKTVVENSTIGSDDKRAKKITVASDNKVTTHFYNENVSGALVAGIGVGVGVNTVDTVTLTNITNSNLYSRNDIAVDAKDNISLNGTMVQATVGALSVGVSTLHNYVNTTTVKEGSEQAVWETESVKKEAGENDSEWTANKADQEAKTAVDKGNALLEEMRNKTPNMQSTAAKIKDGTKTVRTKHVVDLPNSGTKVNLAGANLYAAKDITTTAKSTVNSDTDLGGGSLGIVNIQVEVNKQHIKGDVGVNVTGGVMEAKGNITLNSLMDGLLKNKTVQASVSGAQILVTYSNVTKEEGGTAITLDSAKLTTDKNITLLSEDTRAIDHLAVGASVAVLSGSGYDISSLDKAVSKITLQNTKYNAGDLIPTELSGANITLNNYSKPAVKTKVVAAGVSIASGSGVIAESKSTNQALMNVTDGVKLLGDVVTLDNGVNNQAGKYTLDTDVTGVSVSGLAIHVNKARTYSDIKATTTVGAITLKTKQETDEQGNSYTVGISDLTVNAFDATNIHNDIRGVTVGVLAASGSNYSQSDLKSTVTTTINAGTEGLNVGKLNVHAKGHDTLKSVANGDGGGVVNISPVAAKVESKITGTTTTTLTGTFNIANDLTAEAMRTDDLTYLAKSVEATLVGGSGTELDIDNITETTTTNLNGATINVSGKADINAHTAVNINDDNSYAVRGNGIGGVSVYVSDLSSVITLKNKVNVADSKIYGSKNINLSAYTDGYINLANYDYAVSIVFSNATAKTTSTITVNDGVDITGTSEIRTKKAGSDVTVAAYDDLELYLRSYAEVASGLTSGVTTNTTSNLTRNNKINLTSGKIFSTQDVNLLAGKKNNYSVAEMNMRIEAETFSGGLISLYNNPSVTNKIYQNNQIAIAAEAESQSIRHTNLYAGNGRESIYKLSEYHSLVHSGDESEEAIKARYVSTDQGNIGGAVTRNNTVTVEGDGTVEGSGSVTAGIANVIQIDIGTTAGDWVILDPVEKAMVDANDDHFDDHSGDHPVWGEGDKDKFIHLTDGDGNDKTTFFRDVLGITLDDFILGSENVVQNLNKRLEEVAALLGAYKDDGNKTVYNGLLAEKKRLEDLIKQMGTNTSTEGVNSPRRDYIEIPDLVASGGNVVVETGNFNGSGSVTANGDPSITINNYTNLALVTNSIVVDDPGGIIYYNNKELNPDDTTKTMQEQVKELNKNSDDVSLTLEAAKGNSAGAFINGIYNSEPITYSGGTYSFIDNIPADVDKTKIFFKEGDNKVVDGNNTTVAVKGTDGKWHKGTESGEILSDDFYANASEKTQTIAAGSYDPMADIIIHGNIMTPKGSVTVHANLKNIIVEGKTAKDAVVISGKIVSLKADNGSITQGFTDGIVNIGGTPEDQYAEFYNKAKQEMYYAAEGTKREYDLIIGTPADGQKAPDPAEDKDGNIIGNWIAGGQVYINATDININGVIQSGYETFKADITTAQQQAINNVVTAWKNNGAKALTDTEVKNSGITYRVVEGGAYWNASKGCYDYVVDVFYNPYTGKLVTADVNASGGRVYLTGRISSTGNGKIICLDGAYNIDISNKLNYDLNIGSLVVNDTQGLIQITDSNVNAGDNKKAALVTEIRNGSVVTYSSLDPDHYLSNDRISGSGRNYVYTPVEGLRYNWVTGYKSTSYRRYTITTMDKWWGAMDGTPSEAELNTWESGMQPFDEGTTGADKPRENGIYLSGNSGSTSAGMTVLHSRTDGKTTKYQEGAPRKWSTGYLGCHKWVQYTWRNETGNVQYDYASVNASNPINITFIGVKAEDSHVNVTSTQNINVGGVIGNTQLYEIKNGDTVTGRIEKGTINITSNNGSVVQNAGSMYGATVNLSAKNDLSNIAVTAGDSVNFTGIIKDIGSADVVIDNNYQAKGNVILNNFGGAKANGASLTATGDIHQASTNNLVQAARIDLISKDGEIAGLNNTSMRIQGGQADDVVGSDTMLASVNAQAKGNIDLIQVKGDLRVGTIYSEAGDVSATVPEGGIVDALPYEPKTDRISDDELLAQWRQMGLIPGADGKKTEEQKEKDLILSQSKQDYDGYKQSVTTLYGKYEVLKAKAPEDLTKSEQELLTSLTNTFGTSTLDEFLANNETAVKARDNQSITKQTSYTAWNPDQLLYSIQSSVINPTTGVETTDKAVNFFGNNITLTVRDGAGLNSNTIRTIDLTTLGDMDSKGNLIHLNDLKALSTADASTVKWYASENKATIQERLAIGLQQSVNPDVKGKITIAKYTNTNNGQNNIFVESRKRTDFDPAITQNFDMNLYMAYTTQGDVQINTWGNLYNAMEDDVADILPVILGKNIVINTGAAGTADYGSIGTATKHMTIALGGGNLSATATGNIYLDNNDANPLWIASMSAGKKDELYNVDGNSGNIFLKSTSDIYLVERDSDIQGFIRSESNGMISIRSDASIGSAEHVVRILNSSKDQKANAFASNEGVISLTAGKDIYVEGVSTATPAENKQSAAGYFNLAELGSTDGNVQITLNGTLNLKEDVNVTKTFTLNINREAKIDKDITAKDIVINATNSIYLLDKITDGVVTDWVTLNAETVTLATSKLPVLTYGTKAYSEASLTGGIYQGNTTYYSSGTDAYISGKIDITNVNTQKVFSSKSKILANELKATASNGIYLGGKNDINNVVLDNSMNNVVYHNVADVDSSETGDVLTIGISHHNNPSDAIVGTIWVYNEEATKTQDSVQHAKPMAVTSGVYALNSIDLKSNGDLVNQYEIASIQGSVYLEAGYEGIVTGTTETFVKKGDLENYGSISANPKIYADIGTNKVDIYATGDLHNHGQGLNGMNVNIIGDDGVKIVVLGNAVNEADIYSKDAYVYMGSGGTMLNRGIIKADGGFAAIGADCEIKNHATIEAKDNVFLISGKDIYNGVELSGNQTSTNNNIHVYAGEDILLLAVDGLDNRADLFAGIRADGSSSSGGNVYLDDFEILDKLGVLSDEVKNLLQAFAGEYWGALHGISRSSDADIKNTGNIVAARGTTAGKGLIYLDSQGMTINSGKIFSDNGQVFMDSSKDLVNHGNIYVVNGDNTVSDCKVDLLATGSVYNAGNIYVKGKGAVTLDADAVNADDLELASKTIEEIRAVRTTATVNKLNAQGQETGEMIRFSGVYNTGNIFATTGDVELKTYADVQSSGNIFTGNGSATLNAAENVRNTGDMFVNGTNCEVKMVAENGNVVNTSDLLFKKDVFFSLTGNSLNIPSGDVIYAEGGIQLLAEKGNLYNSKELISKGNIVLKAKGDIIIETDPWADESIYMDESSKMTRIKNIKTTGGSVTIEGRNVVNNMQVEADKGIFVIAHAEHDSGGNAIVNTGTIKVKSNNGHFITNSGNVELTADGYWEHNAYEGQKFSISNGGVNDLVTGGGDIILHGTYSVENVGDIKAKKGGDSTKGNAFLTSDSGNIYNYEYADEEYLVFTEMDAAEGVIRKAVTDEWGTRPRSIEVEGNITWKAVKVYNKAGQYADGDLEIDVNNGGYNGGKISVGGNVTLKCDKDNFTFTNSITAGGAITLLNTSGSLKILDGASMRAGKDININAGDYVESGIRIEAGEGVNVYSENGYIKVENGITANDGMIRVYSQRDDGSTGGTATPYSHNVEIGGTIFSANGSINISTNSGGIQANNVFAKDLAAVASLGGDVTIKGSTKGQKVTFYTEDEAAELSFEKVQFVDEIIMAANSGPGGRSIDMSQVEILSDNYKMGLYGAGGTTGKGNYTLDYEDVEGNVEISNLKGDTINIVANEEVKIDNVSVSREANIYTMGTKTKIYGTVGPTDAASNEIYYAPGGSQSINLHEVFFDDVHTGNPATRNKDKSPQVQKMMEDSSQFVTNHGGGKGMSLHIVDSSLQYGTGIVLMDTYGSNVMSNRYSVTDTMIFLENIKAQAQFDNYFNIGMNFFDRYNIIDIPTVTVNSIGLSSKGQESNGIVVVPAKEDEYEF